MIDLTTLRTLAAAAKAAWEALERRREMPYSPDEVELVNAFEYAQGEFVKAARADVILEMIELIEQQPKKGGEK